MAHFVAYGSLRMDAVVPPEMNAGALKVFENGIPATPFGAPVADAFPEGIFARRLVELPQLFEKLVDTSDVTPPVDPHRRAMDCRETVVLRDGADLLRGA
jgi:hypothetical protein